MNDIVFEACRLIATIIGLIVAYYLIPALKAAIGSVEDKKLHDFIMAAVYAAQQTISPKEGQDINYVNARKKDFVKAHAQAWLNDRGIDISAAQLDILIESAVLAMKTEIK